MSLPGTDVMNGTDNIIASVDATMAVWISAFESSSEKERERRLRISSHSPHAKGPPTRRPWEDSEAYMRRLRTYEPLKYFAKPLSLSPLVCAAFGWENTGRDIIKCCNPGCGATICVVFHPDLNKESHDKLCHKYLGMLASSHASGCPFRTFSRRWSKASLRHSFTGNVSERSKRVDTALKENDQEDLTRPIRKAMGDSEIDFYVPPYFLSLSNEFSRFEDCTGDGSIMRDRVNKGALQIRDELLSENEGRFKGDISLSLPESVMDYCEEVLPGASTDSVFKLKDSTMKVPYLLSIFGWFLSDETVVGKRNVVVKCGICQARAWLVNPSSVAINLDSGKRRFVDAGNCAKLDLIKSHRLYCPHIAGFSAGQLPGWKVTVSNLLKHSATTPVERG